MPRGPPKYRKRGTVYLSFKFLNCNECLWYVICSARLFTKHNIVVKFATQIKVNYLHISIKYVPIFSLNRHRQRWHFTEGGEGFADLAQEGWNKFQTVWRCRMARGRLLSRSVVDYILFIKKRLFHIHKIKERKNTGHWNCISNIEYSEHQSLSNKLLNIFWVVKCKILDIFLCSLEVITYRLCYLFWRWLCIVQKIWLIAFRIGHLSESDYK